MGRTGTSQPVGTDRVPRPGGARRRAAGAVPAACLLTACLITVAGCGGGGLSAKQQSYLTTLHDQVPDINSFKSDTALVRLGQAVCADLAAGAAFGTVANEIEPNVGRLPVSDLGMLITTAAQQLCPRYAGQVQ